jgi:hypothetical protein
MWCTGLLVSCSANNVGSSNGHGARIREDYADVESGEALQFIGVPASIAVASGFTGTRPQSVRELIASCRDPRLPQWSNPSRGRAEDRSFSEEAQGIGTDGQHRFLSNNANDDREGLCKLDWNFHVIAKLPSPFDPDGTHVGALSVREGFVYVALQGPHGVWKVSTDFNQSIFLRAEELPDSEMFAWCDRNPHNGHIYTCAFHTPVTSAPMQSRLRAR